MKELTLPSGRRVVLREGKGRDLLNAQRIAHTPEEIAYALIAELTELEGKKLVLEDLLELDIKDVLRLQTELLGNFQFPQPDMSSSSADTQAGD